MTHSESDIAFTVTLKAHPVNAWLLRVAANGYISIDNGAPVKLAWNSTHAFRAPTSGVHDVEFVLKYFDKLPASSRTFRPRIENGDSFTLVNGWSNQHPFTLERNDE